LTLPKRDGFVDALWFAAHVHYVDIAVLEFEREDISATDLTKDVGFDLDPLPSIPGECCRDEPAIFGGFDPHVGKDI
jgi:hypothetical protein